MVPGLRPEPVIELIAEPHRLYRCRALAYRLGSERAQRPGRAIDAVGREAAGRSSCRVEETPLGVEAESARHGFGRRVPGEAQLPAGGIDRKADDAVVAAVAYVKELAGWRQVDLRAGVALAEPG